MTIGIINYPDYPPGNAEKVLASEIADLLTTEQGLSITIPDIYATIYAYAFYGHDLKSIIIPDSITTIGAHAFRFNELTSAVIPDSVTFIGYRAFDDNKLTSIAIPDSIDAIDDGVFSSNLLTSVVIPDSVRTIGRDAFSHNKLSNITIGEGVTSIDDWAFSDNQLASIVIPDSVTSIGDYAFSSNELTSVVIGEGVTSIGSNAFDDNPLEFISIAADAVFDLSAFPDSVEIIRRDTGATLSTSQVQFIDDITNQQEISTFILTQSIEISDQTIKHLIVGTESKDRIIGSSDGEIIAGGGDKDVLKGGGNPDGFLFQDPEGFGKKVADKIKDFDSGEGDSLLIDEDVFYVYDEVSLLNLTGKKAAKNATDSKEDFVYDNKKGLLYYNENGNEEGWGDGGLFVKLKGAPVLGVEDFTIV